MIIFKLKKQKNNKRNPTIIEFIKDNLLDYIDISLFEKYGFKLCELMEFFDYFEYLNYKTMKENVNVDYTKRISEENKKFLEEARNKINY